jgi:hypothetical protein
VSLDVPTGAVTKNILLTETTSKNANTILVDSNLEVNMVYGLKVGLVVEKNGMNQVVLGVTIEGILKLLKLNSVSIMVIRILTLSILIAIVEDHSFIQILVRKENLEMMSHAIIILDTSNSKTKRVGMAFGLVVTLKKEKVSHVLRTNISSQNGQMKMLKSISLINLSRTPLSNGKEDKLELILSSMVDSLAILEMLKLMSLRILRDHLNCQLMMKRR